MKVILTFITLLLVSVTTLSRGPESIEDQYLKKIYEDIGVLIEMANKGKGTAQPKGEIWVNWDALISDLEAVRDIINAHQSFENQKANALKKIESFGAKNI